MKRWTVLSAGGMYFLVLGFAFLSAEEFGVPRDVFFFEIMDANVFNFEALRSHTV